MNNNLKKVTVNLYNGGFYIVWVPRDIVWELFGVEFESSFELWWAMRTFCKKAGLPEEQVKSLNLR